MTEHDAPKTCVPWRALVPDSVLRITMYRKRETSMISAVPSVAVIAV